MGILSTVYGQGWLCICSQVWNHSDFCFWRTIYHDCADPVITWGKREWAEGYVKVCVGRIYEWGLDKVAAALEEIRERRSLAWQSISCPIAVRDHPPRLSDFLAPCRPTGVALLPITYIHLYDQPLSHNLHSDDQKEPLLTTHWLLSHASLSCTVFVQGDDSCAKPESQISIHNIISCPSNFNGFSTTVTAQKCDFRRVHPTALEWTLGSDKKVDFKRTKNNFKEEPRQPSSHRYLSM